MENKANRVVFAIVFWIVALFLFVSAASPLFSISLAFSKSLSAASAIVIAIGGLLCHFRPIAQAIKNAPKNIETNERMILRTLTWAAILVAAAICIGYLVANQVEHFGGSNTSVVITPFALFFFYMGRWCVLKAGTRI